MRYKIPLFTVVGLLISSLAFSQYCTSGLYFSGCQAGDDVGVVQFGAINNNTNNCPGGSGGYADFTNKSTTVRKGDTLSITVGTSSSTFPQGFGVWIDFDQDGVFSASEAVYLTTSVAASPTTFTGQVVIPSSAKVGETRLRVRGRYYSTMLGTQSCTQFNYGETEDYSVLIAPPPVPQDAGIVSIDTPAQTCTHPDSQNVTITVSNYGTDTIFSLPVAYQLDNKTAVWDTINTVLTPYSQLTNSPTDSIQVTFDEYIKVGGQSLHVIDAWVNLNDDTLAFNDSINGYSPNSLHGVYQIGGGPDKDFNSFNDAHQTLQKSGVCDTVIFEVVDSVFNEQLVLQPFQGASVSNPVIFRSKNGDPNSTVLFYDNSGFSNNYTLLFKKAEHYQFKNLTIANTSGGSYTRVLTFAGQANYNIVKNSVLRGDISTTSTGDEKAVIFVDGNSVQQNKFIDNSIEGGSYGFYMYGDYSNYITGTQIIDNHFKDQYYYGGYFYYHENLTLEGNIYETNNAASMPDRFYFSDMYGVLDIRGNILKAGSYAGNGFYINDMFGTAAFFINNQVHVGDSGASIAKGIVLNDVDQLMLANNSFYIESQNASSTAIHDDYSNDNLKIYNNNIYNDGPGYGIYEGGGIVQSDYNNIYVPDGNVGYAGGDQSTLANWQSATGFDNNGMSISPGYYNPDDLHTCQDSLDRAAKELDTVKQDIDGEIREEKPDIGADEFYTPSSFQLGEDRKKCPSESIMIGKSLKEGAFRWSNGDTTARHLVKRPGNYVFTYVTRCGTMRDSVKVINYKDPEAQFSTDRSNLTVNIQNNTTHADSFYWNFGDGYTAEEKQPYLHIYDTGGTYNIQLAVKGKCSRDTIYKTITINEPQNTGIVEKKPSLNFTIYPNPASSSGNFKLSLSEFTDKREPLRLVITNTLGEKVYEKEIARQKEGQVVSVETSQLKTGVYFVKLIDKGISKVKKLIINNTRDNP